MGFRFRKSFKVAPGVNLNLGKKSAGVSIGSKGFRTSFSSNGRKTTSVGIPGTGLSYVSSSGGNSNSKGSSNSSKGSVKNMKSSKKGGCWVIFAPLLIILFLIGGIGSCLGGDDETTTTTVASSTGIESFDFLSSEAVNLEVGESDRSYFTVEFEGDEFSTDDIVFVSSDESIATITFDKKVASSFIYYYVNAMGSGTTTVHVETVDGIVKSEEITVTVTEESTTEVETTAEITTEKTAETTKKQATTENKTEYVNAPVSDTVYVLNTSRMKIHYKSCPSVDTIASHNYDETDDYDAAIAQGYEPCGRCNP